jgi:hypothetical protein
MNKKLAFLIMVLLITINCFANAPIATTITDTTKIILKYDTLKNQLTQSGSWGLSKQHTYQFCITGVNTALFTTKYGVANQARVATLPALFNNIIPNGSLTTVKTMDLLSAKTAKISISGPPGRSQTKTAADSLFDHLIFDYSALQVISAGTKNLTDYLNNNWSRIKLCRDGAANTLQDVTVKIKSLAHSLLGTTVYYKEIYLTNPDSLKNIDTLRSFLTVTLTDFSGRITVINAQKDFKLTSEQSISLINMNAEVTANLAYLKTCPDIINAIKTCKDTIYSKLYQPDADYLHLTITLLKPKYSSSPDTMVHTKFNFYREKYWKLIDVSAGYFYDNLSARNYYFLAGKPTAEIKSKADFSVGALVHSYYAFTSFLKAGPCLGAAISLLDAKTKYMAGGSIILGRNNEFAFSGGLALASLPQPSNLYQPVVATQTGTVNTYNKIQPGLFVGLTYSFLSF